MQAKPAVRADCLSDGSCTRPDVSIVHHRGRGWILVANFHRFARDGKFADWVFRRILAVVSS